MSSTRFTLHIASLGILITSLSSPAVLRVAAAIPPASPTALIANVANCRQVDLSWTASADAAAGSGIKNYVIHRSDGVESTIRAVRTTFSDAKRVTPSTALTYAVSAVDVSGNESAASNAVTVTTPACSSNEHGVGDFEGELEVSVEDYLGGKSRTLYVLKTAEGWLPLHFAGNPPGHLLTGADVHVRGTLADGALAVASGDTSIETLNLNLNSTSTTTWAVNTLGQQNTVVLLINFQDNPATRPWTFDDVRSAYSSVSNFFWESSYQQTWLSTDVFGWYILPMDSTVCNLTWIANYAQSAATAAGVNLSAYARQVYIFPSASSCLFAGTSTVGGNPSQTWINGGLNVGTLSHEMGHGLGLMHSHSLVCNNAADGSGTMTGPYCFGVDYGDGLDTMGWGTAPLHFNAFQKEVLGWLNSGVSPPMATVQTSGTYVLDLYELTGAKPKALKILKSIDATTGLRTWYYVEYRQATGFDSFLAAVDPTVLNSTNILNGVLIRTGSEESKNTSYLLDMTPETYLSTIRDPALDVGKSFSDSLAGVTIIPQWVNSASAGVSVTLSPPSCVHAIPTVALSPSSQSAAAGAALTYSVSVTNNDGASCSASTLSLQAAVPAGWSAAFGASALTINPGTNTSTTLTVTSPVSATTNSYSIAVTAANGAYAATATATYSIATVSTAVSTDKVVYSAGDTVTSIDTTTIGVQPVANAGVTFTVTKPNGVTVTQSTTTDSNGKAVYKLKLNKQKDPKGIYYVGAIATSNGASANAKTSFTVQ